MDTALVSEDYHSKVDGQGYHDMAAQMQDILGMKLLYKDPLLQVAQ